MPRHDVAIYAPMAAYYYDRAAEVGGGGAERQTVLLARSLARRGLRVAHVVYAVADPIDDAEAPVTLVQCPWPRAQHPAGHLLEKGAQLWRSLGVADAEVQVFRGASAVLAVAGAWTRLRDRRLVFAGANDSDFTGAGAVGSRGPRARLFDAGLRRADAVVVQSADQLRAARPRTPGREPVQLNSFVEAAPPAGPGEAFLWVSRLVDYKQPLLYAELAAAIPEARFWMVPVATEDAAYADTLSELRRRCAALDNLELLEQRPHAELQQLIGRAVAVVNTSSHEGMPNVWLEAWARGVPALTYAFDPDRRIVEHRLGVSAGGDWEAFVAGARDLWAARRDRGPLASRVRDYVADAHGARVADGWAALVGGLSDRTATSRRGRR